MLAYHILVVFSMFCDCVVLSFSVTVKCVSSLMHAQNPCNGYQAFIFVVSVRPFVVLCMWKIRHVGTRLWS